MTSRILIYCAASRHRYGFDRGVSIVQRVFGQADGHGRDEERHEPERFATLLDREILILERDTPRARALMKGWSGKDLQGKAWSRLLHSWTLCNSFQRMPTR